MIHGKVLNLHLINFFWIDAYKTFKLIRTKGEAL